MPTWNPAKEANMPDLIARLAFSTKVRSRIWKQLAKLLQNRMHLHEALRLLKFQAEERKSPLANVYTHILHKLGRGRTLGAALDGLASREETLLISSAQDSSRLAGGLLLASKYPKLLDRMLISGANTRPDAVSKRVVRLFKVINFLHKKPLFELMLTEPHITKEQLQAIETPTLVLAGSKDLVLEEDTRFIAESIPKATLQILPGESHTSYIVHKEKIAELILDYCLR